MSAAASLFVLLACTSTDPGPAPTGADGGGTAADSGDPGAGSGGSDSGGSDSGGSDSGDGTTDGGTTDPGPDDDGWFGEPLDPAWPVPAFVATNMDGTARGPDDLTGDPTIIWFYRDAGSSG